MARICCGKWQVADSQGISNKQDKAKDSVLSLRKCMSNRIAEKLNCKQARKLFAPLTKDQVSEVEQQLVAQHIESCPRCADEQRLTALYHTTLKLSGSPEVITPDEEFFIALRARIARGAEQFAPTPVAVEESWAAALLLTARQLIPAMALLLLLIFGATVLWSNSSRSSGQSAQSQISEPTPYDSIDLSVIVAEERGNGR